MVILEDYIKKESSHWCEGKVCDIPHHYISKEKASEVVILMLWVDELRVGRSLAKEKKRPFSFFKKLKGSTTQDYFEWKKYTHLKKPTPIFSFHPYVYTYITQHYKKRFLTSKYTPSVRATYRPRNFKVYGRHHQTEILSLYSIDT